MTDSSIDLLVLMSVCGDTEPPYWRVDGAALVTDEEHVTQLTEAFFMSIHYSASARLLTVKVTIDEHGKPTAEVKPAYAVPTEIPPWLY